MLKATHAQGPRRRPARRVGGAREHDQRRGRLLGRPGGPPTAAPPSRRTTSARATARSRRTSQIVKYLPRRHARLHRHQRRPLHGAASPSPSIYLARQRRALAVQAAPVQREQPPAAIAKKRRHASAVACQPLPRSSRSTSASTHKLLDDAGRDVQGARPASWCCSTCRATRPSSARRSTKPVDPDDRRLQVGGGGAERPLGELRRQGARAQRQLLRPLAPRAAGRVRLAGRS